VRNILYKIIVGVVVFILVIVLLFILDIYEPRSRSSDAKRISDMKQLQLALELYHERSGAYPTGDYKTTAQELVDTGMLVNIPEDSKSKIRSYRYVYIADQDGESYLLRAKLKDKNHSSLSYDLDGTIFLQECNDPYYCLGSGE